MKQTDTFDKVHLLLLGLVLLLLAILFVPRGDRSPLAAGTDRGVEREMVAQARVALLQKLYGPVEDLTARGELQTALLKLDELSRQYPGEAHGHILQGSVMQRLGALEQALSSYGAGVRLNGEYLDKRSPLSRRTQIAQLVEEGGRDLLERARTNPTNSSVKSAVHELRYLQSRLAGGCE